MTADFVMCPRLNKIRAIDMNSKHLSIIVVEILLIFFSSGESALEGVTRVEVTLSGSAVENNRVEK